MTVLFFIMTVHCDCPLCESMDLNYGCLNLVRCEVGEDGQENSGETKLKSGYYTIEVR